MSSPENLYSTPCTDFINGHCKRENMGGCPYVHDHCLRKENLENKRFQASRAKLQKNYTQHSTSAELPPNTSLISSALCWSFAKGNCTYVGCRFSHNEDLRKATLEEVRLNTTPTTSPQEQSTTPPALQQPKMNGGAKEFCPLYTNGQFCKYQNSPKGCRFVHDLNARRETLAKREKILAAKSDQEHSEMSIPNPTQLQNSRPRETCRNFSRGFRCYKTPCPFLHVQSKGASDSSEQQIEPAKAANINTASLQTGSLENCALTLVDSGRSSEHVDAKSSERIVTKSNLGKSNGITDSVEEAQVANLTPTELFSDLTKKHYNLRQLKSGMSSVLFEHMIDLHIAESQPTKYIDEVETEDEQFPPAIVSTRTPSANTKELPIEGAGTKKAVESATESPRGVVEQTEETSLIDVSIPESGPTIQFIPEWPRPVSRWYPIPLTSGQQSWTEGVSTTGWGMAQVIKPGTISSTALFPILGLNDTLPENFSVASWDALEAAVVRRSSSIASKNNTTTPNSSSSSNSKSTTSTQPPKELHWDTFEITRWARENLKPSEINPYLSKFHGVPLLNIPDHLIAAEKAALARKRPKRSQRTFHLFGKLPTELRLQVWKLAVDNEVKHTVRIKIKHRIVGEETLHRFVPRTPPPALLHASSESRPFALQRWKLSFSTATAGGYTYFDFNTDRVFLHTRNCRELVEFVQYLNPEEASRVRFLSLPLRDGANNLVNGEFARCIAAFNNIKTVKMAIGDGQEDIEYWGQKKQKHEDKLRRKIAPWWWAANGSTAKSPAVKIYTVPALKAKKWKINGIFWA